MRTKPCLTASDVKKMLAAADAKATANQWSVAIVILDEGAHALGLLRLDGSTPSHVEIAMGKARTAALARRPSRLWAERLQQGQLQALALPYTPAQGGLPIMVNGECVGSIAASGAKGEEDEQVAQAGIDSLGI